MTKFLVIHIFRPTCTMYDSLKVHFSCLFFFFFFFLLLLLFVFFFCFFCLFFCFVVSLNIFYFNISHTYNVYIHNIIRIGREAISLFNSSPYMPKKINTIMATSLSYVCFAEM